ncbi:hypothetical protein BH09ACT10_BH09ACT10_24310 [soil metagenome]
MPNLPRLIVRGRFSKVLVASLLTSSAFLISPASPASATQTFTVSPGTKFGPTGKVIKHKNLNKNTKQYFLIRTYLSYFEKHGGGTLVLRKGTYKVPNTLYVGSNVTIHLNSGARLLKWNKTKGMKVASSMFQTIGQSKSKKKGYYGGYNGEKNITFEGDPGSVIDLRYFKTGMGIVAGHTRNLTIKGITFKRMKYGHYIELSATQHTVITNNRFGKTKKGGVKEAINIDTPDRSTKGVNYRWTKFDKTPNDDVLISHNVFSHVNRAVGTHKFSKGRYHNNIRIINNKVDTTYIDAFQVLNWKNSVLAYNTISDVANYKKSTDRAFLVGGSSNVEIKCNVMTRVPRPVGIFPWRNSNPGKDKNGWTYPNVTAEDRELLKANRLVKSSPDSDARIYMDNPVRGGSVNTSNNMKIELDPNRYAQSCS